MHIRRTDKLISEAKFYSLHDYMIHVENYFEILNHLNPMLKEKTVFLMTDDENVIKEFK